MQNTVSLVVLAALCASSALFRKTCSEATCWNGPLDNEVCVWVSLLLVCEAQPGGSPNSLAAVAP